MNIKQISLIEPKPKEKSIWSIVKQPKVGLVLLATILKSKGYKVKVFCENVSPIDWDYVYNSDICGISYLTHTANEAYSISKKIMAKKIPVIHGGPHATIVTEDALKHCDIVLTGEAEITLPRLLKALNNKQPLEKIKGISFKKNKKIINNPSNDVIDIDKLPSPDLSLIHDYEKKKNIDYYIRTGIISTSRGCPYDCEFCSVIKLFGRNYRQRSVKNIIKDIKAHLKVRRPGSIFFVDDNFIVNKKKTKELLKEIIKNNFNIPFTAQIRASSADDEEMVKLMRKAGIHLVFIGFESINQETLNEYNKNQKVEEMVKAIKTLKKNNIRIHGMFVFGSDFDKPEIVDNTLKFCLKHDIDTIQFFPLTAFPGTRLTERLIKENRVIDIPWNYYDAQRVNIFPKNIRPSVLQGEIVKAYKKFYSLKRSMRLLLRRKFRSFYINFFGSFILRGESKAIERYIQFLKKKEEARYKGNTLIA